MAFGKDDSHLGSIAGYGAGTFGQQAHQAAQRPRRSRGSMPYWKNNFDLSENPATPDTFRLIKGQYKQQLVNVDGQLYEDILPFHAFREHFHGSSSKGAICSAGPFYLDREKRQPCEGCEMYWTDYQERQAKKARGDQTRGPNRISMMDKFAFSVWDYGIYFDMPQVDRNGQFRMNPKTNAPYTEWVKAYNFNDPQYQGRQWKQGDLRPWAIGKTWKDTLVNWTLTIGLSCSSCGGQNSVYSKGWYCGNPQCRQLIFDPNNTTLSPEQQLEVQRSPYQCPHCGQKLFPHEEVGCHSCANPTRASIFDVDLVGYRQRSGNGNQTNLIITQVIGPCPIRIQDPEVLKTVKALDLPKLYAPTPLDVQQKLWGITTSTAQQMNLPQPQGAPPQQQWAPPPAPGQVQPPPGHTQPQGAYQPPAAPQQSDDPNANDISAQLAALSRSFGQ